MEIGSAIVGSAMEMKAMQFATEYATGVMAMELDMMEDIGAQLAQQMLSLDVGAAPQQMLDVLV